MGVAPASLFLERRGQNVEFMYFLVQAIAGSGRDDQDDFTAYTARRDPVFERAVSPSDYHCEPLHRKLVVLRGW